VLRQTEKFDSGWRSSPSVGNSFHRRFCLTENFFSRKFRLPNFSAKRIFLIQNFSYERNLGRLGRGPTDAIHEAATLNAVPDIVSSYQPLLEGNLDPLAFDVAEFQGSLNSTIGLRR
jgi:hypothetical protein